MRKQISYLQALEYVAKRIACIQIIPYHSKDFGNGRLIGNLPSSKEAIDFARNELAERAKNDEITIVVTRRIQHWGLREGRNVILYTGNETRGAYFTPRSRKKILERLLNS